MRGTLNTPPFSTENTIAPLVTTRLSIMSPPVSCSATCLASPPVSGTVQRRTEVFVDVHQATTPSPMLKFAAGRPLFFGRSRSVIFRSFPPARS
ncbi:hypothetical protein [Nonomuraea recticatena]|uniref:hypothetical protein n=1 Tax=Nonomuraea recticatena TaxID=46178 RepID=UPI003620CB64